MKVGITGVNGFLGIPLAQQLLNGGHEVYGIDDFFRQKTDSLKWLCSYDNFKFTYGDILDKSKLQSALGRCDIIFHLAALVGEPICKQFPSKATYINIEGTKNVVDLNIPVIYHSTGSVYGKIEEICTETTPAIPISHYGVTKLEAEKIVTDSGGIALRLSTAFGLSGNHRVKLLINDFVDRAINDGTITVFQGDFQRSFIYVTDIVLADIHMMNLLSLLEHEGEVFNVGHPEGNWSKRRLAEYLKKRTGCHVVYADAGYVDPDQRNYEISFEKMYKTGWTAQVSMETGISKLINSATVDNIKF